MSVSGAISTASVLAGLTAFAVAAALSLRAQVEPLYAVLRGIAAFAGVMWAARWTAGVAAALSGEVQSDGGEGAGGSGAEPPEHQEGRRRGRRARADEGREEQAGR